MTGKNKFSDDFHDGVAFVIIIAIIVSGLVYWLAHS
jgi:hypothetical protein